MEIYLNIYLGLIIFEELKTLHYNSLLFELEFMIWILKEKYSSILSFLLNNEFDSLFCDSTKLMLGMHLTTDKEFAE